MVEDQLKQGKAKNIQICSTDQTNNLQQQKIMMHSSSGEKLEMLMRNPFLVKAGIPLLLSATALITAKILKNRAASTVIVKIEEDEAIEMLEDLKRRELELEKRFLNYQELKEKESVAMEMRNKVGLEMNKLEFLAKEASLMEDEARRMEEFMVEYSRLMKKVESLGFEKGLVEKKVRKMRRRLMEMSKVVKRQSLCLKGRDAEMIKFQMELGMKNEAIVELEGEIGLVKVVLDQLKEEKIELLNKFEIVENSASTKTKIDEEFVRKEAYDKVKEELEKTVKDQEAMENELIHLRWSNACLKHEIKSCQEQLEKKSHLEVKSSTKEVVTLQQLFHEVECDDGSPVSPLLVHGNEGSCLTQDERFSKRKRFVKKLKKWVEGGKVDEKKKNEEMIKCFGRHSVAHSEEAYESYVHPRNSFSSV